MSTIERLKELEAKATGGRWHVDMEFGEPIVKTDTYSGEYYRGNVAMLVYDGLSNWERPTADADAALIAEMRNALPKLLAVVEAARGWVPYLEVHGMGVDLIAALDGLESEK